MPPAATRSEKEWKGVVKGTKKKKRRYDSYKNGLLKVLKQSHPDLSLSSKAMNIMNNFVDHTAKRIGEKARHVLTQSKSRNPTLDAKVVQTVLHLILPEELAKHTSNEGKKACVRLMPENVNK